MLGHDEGVDRDYFELYSGSAKVLPSLPGP